MRAYIVNELNHPSQIPLANDVPEPKASENEVLIDVYSAGLNFFDVRIYFHIFVITFNEPRCTNNRRFYKLRENIRPNPLSHSS